MMVFHWAAVRSVGYRSGWHRLQWIEYNSAPVSLFLAMVLAISGESAFGDTQLVCVVGADWASADKTAVLIAKAAKAV